MSNSAKRFGTIGGVFIPNVLTIFGVILFYREGWMVGNSGLLGAIAIILIANAITFFTALSMSAIVTNIKVRGGGAYYLVSRSLGPEMGGSIGIALFFAQAFSIAFYIIGFTMAMQIFFPTVPVWLLNTITLAALTLLAIFSAEIAIKAQYVIFGLVMIALVSFFTGNLNFDVTPVVFGPFKDAGFWKAFAIFFPAVTGMFAGLSLSGDLKDPHKNIPRGTIAAIGFTLVFYILVAIWFAFNFAPQSMITNEGLMIDSAKFPIIVIIGIAAATISSAIGVLLGAPRTLQALSKDGIVPRFLGKGSGPANEPRIAMIFSIILAEVLLLLGSIDFVAQLLAMFFLATYGIINFIAALEVIIGNPGYRPKLKVHWFFSLLGAIGSFSIMFLIDPIATIVAIVIIMFIYFFITKKGLEKNWGDMRKGIWASIIEIALANYEKYEEHPRNWRPHIAIFENNKNSRELLMDIATQIAGKSGIISNYMFRDEMICDSTEYLKNEQAEVQNYLKEKDYNFIYPEIVLTNKNKNSHLIALQADGIGTFKANTIISDFYLEGKSLEEHFKNLRSYDILKKNIILVKGNTEKYVSEDRIDIWISGFKANISMMILIPVLLARNSEWVTTSIHIRMIVRSDYLREKAEKNIKRLLSSGRVNAEVDVISLGFDDENSEVIQDSQKQHETLKEKMFGSSKIYSRLINFLSNFEHARIDDAEKNHVRDIIIKTSQNARLVVMGVRIPEKGKEVFYAADMRQMLKELPTTILVKGNHNINLFL